jgi:predicted transglutaminase-like cysteine proteinase
MSGSGRKHLVGAGLAAVALLAAAPAAKAGAPAMVESGLTSVPYGWVDFCNRYAGECDGPVLPAVSITLTPAVQHELETVTRSVNASVESVTDMDHWGVVDRWDYPLDGKGDCEDYVLMKRKILIEHGLPRQALLVTVVKDHAGEGHAVLTVKTSRADVVLDNMTDKVLRWDETGYRFIKRQSQEDQNRWMSIGVPESEPLFTAR